MSEQRIEMPERLRREVEGDLRPVRPLASPWRRVLYVAPAALAAMAVPFFYYRLRDLDEIGPLLGWVPVAIQILLAFALLVLALREGIPGWHASTGAICGLCLAAYGVQILVNLAIFVRSPDTAGGATLDAWLQCFRVEALIGLPTLLLIAWLVGRSLPERPWLAGFLAGTGAGIAGDASWRLFCPYSHPAHILLGHTGGILILGLTGFLVGFLWSRYERAREA